jgi:SAM-dependent methyltransferase
MSKRRKAKTQHDEIDFEKILLRGRKSYDSAVGDWWESRANNPSHRKAYGEIAAYMGSRCAKAGLAPAGLRTAASRRGGAAPRCIVDYACGSGHFLLALARRFPQARIVALDGSIKMLARAQARLAAAGHEAGFVDPKRSFDAAGPRIRLVETRLPNFSLPQGKADAVAFLFPNLTCGPNDQEYYDRHGYKRPDDVKVAKVLARLREMDPEDEVTTGDPVELLDGLMTERVIGRNIRGLLKPKGLWFKADYANARREELSHLTQLRTLFGEGALEAPVKDLYAKTFFRFLHHNFYRSQVILDVYHQTKDPTDKTGGYFVSAFEAKKNPG